jgi:hypothetical protein
MKQHLIGAVIFSLLVVILASCETLSTDTTKPVTPINESEVSLQQPRTPEAKFVGTWVYSTNDLSKIASALGEKNWPSNGKLEMTLSFRPDTTGTLSYKITVNGIVNETQQEFIWSCTPFASAYVLVVLKDNTSDSFNMFYESDVFLSTNDKDIGIMLFVKQQ